MTHTKHIHRKLPYFSEPVQVQFWNPDLKAMDCGILYQGDIIAGSSGKVFDKQNICKAAPDNRTPLLRYPDWTDFSGTLSDTIFHTTTVPSVSPDIPVLVSFRSSASNTYETGIFYQGDLITAACGTVLEYITPETLMFANKWSDCADRIRSGHNMDLLNQTYPKPYYMADFDITRPYGLCVHGPSIAPKDALEIIRQTDWIFGGGYNSDPMIRKVLNTLGIRTEHAYQPFAEYSLSRQCFDYSKFEAVWGYKPSSYLFCNWFASSNPENLPVHGFCHPDGTIYDCMIQGGQAYYRKFDVDEFQDERFYHEIRNLLFRFPILNLYFDLYSIDAFDDNQNLLPGAQPVVQFHAVNHQIVVDRFEPAPWKSPLRQHYEPLTDAQIETMKIDLSGVYNNWNPID